MKMHATNKIDYHGQPAEFVVARAPRLDGFVLWVGSGHDATRYTFDTDTAMHLMNWLNENVPMEYHLPDDREVREHLAELDEMHVPS